MKYPINEIFYSLKGEGRWTGTPMVFIRLSGCSVNCSFCDTPDPNPRVMNLDEIQCITDGLIKGYTCNHLVITGGEPSEHDLVPLIARFTDLYQIHIETSGVDPYDHLRELIRLGSIDWLTISPKNNFVSRYIFQSAQEIKFLCGSKGWENLINRYYPLLLDSQIKLVMPLAQPKLKVSKRSPNELIQKNIDTAVKYCLDHPEFSLCIQMHKVVGIK